MILYIFSNHKQLKYIEKPKDYLNTIDGLIYLNYFFEASRDKITILPKNSAQFYS